MNHETQPNMLWASQQKHLLTDIIDKSIDLNTNNLIICQTICRIICQTEMKNGNEREQQ